MTGVIRSRRPALVKGTSTCAEMSRFPRGLNRTPAAPTTRFRSPGTACELLEGRGAEHAGAASRTETASPPERAVPRSRSVRPIKSTGTVAPWVRRASRSRRGVIEFVGHLQASRRAAAGFVAAAEGVAEVHVRRERARRHRADQRDLQLRAAGSEQLLRVAAGKSSGRSQPPGRRPPRRRTGTSIAAGCRRLPALSSSRASSLPRRHPGNCGCRVRPPWPAAARSHAQLASIRVVTNGTTMPRSTRSVKP